MSRSLVEGVRESYSTMVSISLVDSVGEYWSTMMAKSIEAQKGRKARNGDKSRGLRGR